MAHPVQDLFAPIARQYRQFRPHYPPALFAYLASLAPGRDGAWDCGTGNGQAALGLAEFFAQVQATDISAEQLRLAFPHPAVRYAVAEAGHSGLPPASVDLVTVGEALHWFDPASFGAEVLRVLRPRGVLAVWNYRHCQVSPAVDRIVAMLRDDVLDGHWAPQALNDDVRGHALPAALAETPAPDFAIEADWTIDSFMGYLGSWSACASYARQHGLSPLALVASSLERYWPGGHGAARVVWQLNLRTAILDA